MLKTFRFTPPPDVMQRKTLGVMQGEWRCNRVDSGDAIGWICKEGKESGDAKRVEMQRGWRCKWVVVLVGGAAREWRCKRVDIQEGGHTRGWTSKRVDMKGDVDIHEGGRDGSGRDGSFRTRIHQRRQWWKMDMFFMIL